MLKIPITQEIIDRARSHEAEVYKTLKKKPNYTGLETKDRYFIGFLGELAFEQLLKINKVDYYYNEVANGESQGADFFVYTKNGAMTIEIKTSNHENASRILINKKQFDFRTFSAYVGIKIEDSIATIRGWCTKDKFVLKEKGFQQDNLPTYYVPFTELSPIQDLLTKIAP